MAKTGIDPRPGALEAGALALGHRGQSTVQDDCAQSTSTATGPRSSAADRDQYPHCSHRRRECGRLSRPCSCLVTKGMTYCLRSCWSALSEHVSPEQSWSPTVRPRVTALNRNSGEPRLQLDCSGGTLPVCVDAGLRGRHSLPSSPQF